MPNDDSDHGRDDVPLQRLLATREEAFRACDAQAEELDRLEEQISSLEERVASLREQHAVEEERLGEWVGVLYRMDDLIAQYRHGGPTSGERPVTQRGRTSHSRRGRVGIRPSILKLFHGRPSKKHWSPREIRKALDAAGIATSQANVHSTLRRMVGDGELASDTYGQYRLPEKQ